MIKSEFWATILGSVIAALVAGLIALLLQNKSLKESRLDREAERRAAQEEREEHGLAVQRGIAHSLLEKLIRINTNLFNINDLLKEYANLAEKAGVQAEPWQVVREAANLPEPVKLSAEERALLIELKAWDALSQLQLLDSSHNGLIEGIRRFYLERRMLMERLPANAVQGTSVVSELDEQQMQETQPQRIRVTQLFYSLLKLAPLKLEETNRALNQIQELLQSELGLDYRYETGNRPDDTLAETVANPSGVRTDEHR